MKYHFYKDLLETMATVSKTVSWNSALKILHLDSVAHTELTIDI